jgi:hypothetical protein
LDYGLESLRLRCGDLPFGKSGFSLCIHWSQLAAFSTTQHSAGPHDREGLRRISSEMGDAYYDRFLIAVIPAA